MSWKWNRPNKKFISSLLFMLKTVINSKQILYEVWRMSLIFFSQFTCIFSCLSSMRGRNIPVKTQHKRKKKAVHEIKLKSGRHRNITKFIFNLIVLRYFCILDREACVRGAQPQIMPLAFVAKSVLISSFHNWGRVCFTSVAFKQCCWILLNLLLNSRELLSLENKEIDLYVT